MLVKKKILWGEFTLSSQDPNDSFKLKEVGKYYHLRMLTIAVFLLS